MGLADELHKLAELKKEGLLTDDEFAQAKKQLLQQGGSAPTPSSAATPPAVTTQPTPPLDPPAPSAPPQDISEAAKLLLHPTVPDHVAQQAVSRLVTLLRNILRDPSSPKFRVVKKTNKILAEEVFKIPGSTAFFQAMGFVDGPETVELPSAAPLDKLHRAIAALEKEVAWREARERNRKRAIIHKEIRDEKRRKAEMCNTIRDHTARELEKEEENLDTILEHTSTIFRAIRDSNQRRFPMDEKSVDEFWGRAGVQEFFLGMAGFEEGKEGDTDILVCPPSVQQQDLDRAFDELSRIVGEIKQRMEEEERRVREEARREMQQARKGIMKMLQKQSGTATDADTKASSAPQPSSSSKRIPIKDALRYLRGEDVDLREQGGAVTQTSLDTAAKREEDATATSLIADISALMEQWYHIKDEQTLTAPWRREAQQLMAKWKEDRDIVHLHETKEKWEKTVAQAKGLPAGL